MATIPHEASGTDAKKWFSSKIDQFIETRIIGAIEVITEKARLAFAITADRVPV